MRNITKFLLLFLLIFLTKNIDSLSYHFDPKTRTEEWKLTDSLSATCTYNALEKPIEYTDWTGTICFTYDNQGLLKEVQHADGEKTEFSYDDHGILCAITEPSGYTISRTLDAKLRTHTLSDNGGLLREYTYDDYDNVLSIRTPSKIVRYTYDSHNRIQEIIDGAGNTTSFDYENYSIIDATGSRHSLK